MKPTKRLMTVVLTLVIASLTACMYENISYESESQPDMSIFMSTTDIDINGLQAVQTFSNEFGVGFLLRNKAGIRLYYNDDFRVDSVAFTEMNNPAGVQLINHGNTKEIHVSWGRTARPTGIYTFERDFFLDSNLTQLYKTLIFDFYVIGWCHFTEDVPPISAELQAMRDNRECDSLAFQIAGGTSNIIILASEVAVSRTGLAFSAANISTQSFMHGLDYRLLVYENGWKPAPVVYEGYWFVRSLGIGMQGGEVIEDSFNFEWLHGALANGRYMIMRRHGEDHMRPGAPRVQEILMVEFIVDDNTPMNLGGTLPTSINININVYDVTPTGLQLNVTNHTSQDFLYNGPSIVQKYVYGNWENIYELDTPARYQVLIGAGGTIAISESWAERFGKLPPGRYQLISHFGSVGAGHIITGEFNITQNAFDEYAGNTQLNPMFEQNVVVTDVAITPAGMTIQWKNVSDCIFYTPWTGYWIESYSQEDGRGWNRLRESFDSTFSGQDANLRRVTVEISGGGAMTFDTTAVHPGQHVYQTIDWERELPAGQYVISLGHFNPHEPGFMYWIKPWERFVLAFVIE